MTVEAKKKLRRLTVTLILAVVVPLFIFWAAIVYFLLDLSYKNAISTSLTTARLVDRQIQKTLSNTFYHLEHHKEEMLEGLEDQNQKLIDHELKEVLFTSPLISSLAQINSNGSGFIHYVIPGKVGHKQMSCPMSGKLKGSQLGWFKDYLKMGKRPIISNVYYSPCSPGYPQIAAVLPIKNKQGKIVAVQAAAFDLNTIKDWFKAIKLPAGLSITLLDRSDQLLYSTASQNSLQTGHKNGAIINYKSLVNQIKKTTKFIGAYDNPLTNSREIIGYIPAKDKNLGVVISQSYSDIIRSAYGTILNFLLVCIGLLVLGLLLVNLVRRAYVRENLALERESQAKEALANSVKELETIATTLQKSFLPTSFPVFAGYEFGAVYHSATKHALIGGDFYDAFKLNDDRLAIMLGDISGRGIEATTLTSLVKNVIKAFALETELGPVEIINKANNVLTHSIEGGHFATVFFGILEKNGHLTYVNCGHPPALLVRHSGQIESLAYTGLPLGFEFAYACGESSIQINPGETLILYTDGLIEARKNNEFFGESGLKQILSRTVKLSVSELPQEVFSQLQAFCSGKLHDDVAILAIKRVPEPEPSSLYLKPKASG